MSLDTTPGGSQAKSYATVEFIDAYAAGTAWASSWDAASAPEKEVFAVRATRAIDTLSFPGYPSFDTQALQFPRAYAPNGRGGYYASDVIPEPLKRAQAHLACWLSSLDAGEDPFSFDETGKLSSLEVGPIGLEFRANVGNDGAGFLASVIVPMLRPWGFVGASGTVRLTR